MRLLLVLLLATAALADGNADINAGVVDINTDVAEMRTRLGAAGVSWYDGHIASLSALHWVGGRVSQWRYLHRQRYGMPLPTGGTASACAASSVELRAGLCAGSAFVFQELLTRIGYQTRKVDAWYPYPSGHALVEVSYGGKWRCYDPTLGCYWVRPGAPWWDVATATEVAAARAGDAWVRSHVTHSLGLYFMLVPPPVNSAVTWWNASPLTLQVGSTVLYQR